jgi:hypothetical protein
MSYFLADAAGYLGDLGSATLWWRFRQWAEALHDPLVDDFLNNGFTQKPRQFARALQRKTAEDEAIDSVRAELIKWARKADEILILTG